MALYDELRTAGVIPTLAMAVASVELQTQVVMALLDELEVEAGERGLSGRERDDWVERQVENLTDLDTDLPASGRAAVTIAGEYRSLVASMPSPADQWIHDLGRDSRVDHLSTRVMSPAEAAAYMAKHPDFARRVEEHGRELAEEYGPRLAGGPMPAGTAPGVADGPATRPADTAREQVGGLLGYILSNGSTPVLSPHGDDPGDGEGADDRPAELAVDAVSPIADPAESDGWGEPEGLGAASLDW